ncbi:SLC13 family permease [Roseomonas sp. OT10]|uniref:SLC13 family permease n=1 Tax=Roseomonas cutis TaxID=2897332 RepID=UPI001E5E9B4F|nr:SLC13 family permease [Roseomonas sp. OT10]UFN50120.1 SLC13 family permease [Roseomonas sp. OT10]
MLLLLGAAVVCFVLDRPRADAVALIALVALPLTGVLTPAEALAGFGDPSVILVAALFVIGEGLVRTGVARALGDGLAARAGHSETRLIVLLMLAAAGLGSVMSSTGVVAIFIPVALRVGTRLGIAPGRLMMPLSVAALISGMLTLVATAPNLVVNAELVRNGLEGFGFFSVTPFGLAVLALSLGWMLLARRWLGGRPAEPSRRRARRRLVELVRDYGVTERLHRAVLHPGSPLAGRSLGQLALRSRHGMDVVAVERPGHFGGKLLHPTETTQLHPGEVLYLQAAAPSAEAPALLRRLGLGPLPLDAAEAVQRPRELGLAELMVTPTSSLLNNTILQARFRTRLGLTVLGLRRGRQVFGPDLTEQPLETGDTLLVVGPWKAIRLIQAESRDVIVLDMPAELEEATPEARRAPHALAATALMVLLMVTGWVPNVIAAILAGLVMGALRCIDLDGAYRAIHWRSLVLIAGMLPFSLALERTGGVALAAQGLVAALGEAGPRALLAGIFAATAAIGLFISNTATAVLMAPVAIAVARDLGLSPYPFAMTVALASSAAFMTPVSSPVNTLVLGPGGYRFLDFVRIGVPLALISMVVTVALVPLLLPMR